MAAPSELIVSRRVLIVDDNQDAAETLAMVLQYLGFETKTACDGSQALVVAEEWHPAVVILDLSMPVMGGFEAAERLRASDSPGRMVLIALSGNPIRLVRQAAGAASFDLLLQKPIDPIEVAMLAEGALSRR